ncbi:MAG: LamG-like jellyroll fold domain-containing protein [Verrucomicrobiota bacterium]
MMHRLILPWYLLRRSGLMLLLGSTLLRAQHVPDAAGRLGTVVINHDDQFTTNSQVTLTINATDDGTGLLQMQFSNDNETWSDPEPYGTNKQWQLSIAPADYPPLMNTVLKTVYVRVQYGGEDWSKAFSDGIVFAESLRDVPLTKEIWIMQSRPTPYDGTQPLGSKLNPHIIAAGANQPAFDTLMNTLANTYSHYRATPGESQSEPPPMDAETVMFLHLGPGTYLTHGDNGGRGGTQCWGPVAGVRIKGAGKDATLLKLVGGNTNGTAHVIGNYGGAGMGVYDNCEISDLTVDANMHEGGDISSYWVRTGVTMLGNNAQLRRLRVKGFGSRIPGLEPGGMTGYVVGNLYNFHVEDCEVIAPQTLNKYNPLMMGFHGGGKDTNGQPCYLINVVVRNNYVNGLNHDQGVAVSPYTTSFFERGTHGVTLGAVKNALVEDNLIEHVMSGYYNDSYDLASVTVRNNHYRDVIAGMNFGTGVADQLVFAGNLVELDPHYYTTPVAGSSKPSDYGWRTGVILNENLRAVMKHVIITNNLFQFTDRKAPTPPLVTSFVNTSLSGIAEVQRNKTWGITNTFIRWYQSEGPAIPYFENQADITDPERRPPVGMDDNFRQDGTIIEIYPYELDRALPRPVVAPNETVTFNAPLIDGKVPVMVTGLPVTNVIDQNGVFTWTPGPGDVGRYVVSFYDSPGRTNDPRRTLFIVQSGVTADDPQFFSTGLRGYWKLGEDFGKTFIDSSGNGNHITIATNALTYLARGAAGQRTGQKALYFENSNPVKTAALTLANQGGSLFGGFPTAYQPYLQRSTTLVRPFTVSYWFKPGHVPATLETIFNYGSSVICGVGPGPQTNKTLAEVFCYYTHSPDLTFYAGAHPRPVYITPGLWHQLAIVYDGTGTKTYLDGVLRTEIPCGQLEDFDPESAIFLGGGWGGDNYLGGLSELAVWNRPLTAGEIGRLFDNQKPSDSPSSVLPPNNLHFTP